jgi:AraC-like DNA-binding protein
MTAKRLKAGADNSPEAKLLSQLEGLPEPVDYYAGQDDPTAVLPRNILFFHRTKMIPGDNIDSAHHRYGFIYCLKTSATLFINERMVELPAGHAMMISPHQFHHFILPEKPIDWLFITFELPESQWLDSLQNLVFIIREFSQKILIQLLEVYQDSEMARKSHLLSHTLGYWLAYLIKEKSPPIKVENDIPQLRSIKIIQQVNAYIYTNLDKDLSIQTLSQNIGVSASHLRFLVKSQIGYGLSSYIANIRVNHAQALLAGTSLSIKHIAFDCGFNSSQSFARLFRKITCVSPSDYRNSRK